MYMRALTVQVPPRNPRFLAPVAHESLDLRSYAGSPGRSEPRPAPSKFPPPPRSPGAISPGRPTELEAAADLMTGRHTQDQHERVVSAVTTACRQCVHGFSWAEAGSVNVLLKGASTLLHAGRTEYEAPVRDLLRTLSRPLHATRATDDVTFEAEAAALLNSAVALLLSAVPAIAMAAADLLVHLTALPGDSNPPSPLLSLLSGSGPASPLPRFGPHSPLRQPARQPAAWQGRRDMLSAGRAQQLIAKTQAADNLLAVLHASFDSALRTLALRALRGVSQHHPTASQLLRSSHWPELIATLSEPLGTPFLPLATEVLSNTLDAEAAEATTRLVAPQVVNALTGLLARASSSGVEADRELRNDVLALAMRIAQACSATDRETLLGGGIFAAALGMIAQDAWACAPPQSSTRESPWAEVSAAAAAARLGTVPLPPVDTASELQFELLQLALGLVAVTSATEVPPFAVPAVRDSQLVAAVGVYLSPTAARRWAPAELAEVRLLSLSVLGNLTRLLPPSATEAGLLASLPFLRAHHQHDLGTRDASLRLLLGALSRDGTLAKRVLANADVIVDLVEMLASTFGFPVLSAAATQDAVLALSLLCEGSPSAARSAAGAVPLLLRLLEPSGTLASDQRLVMTAIDAIWSVVASCEANVARLVERDGVATMLHRLETAPFAIRAHLLSCLADLLAHEAAAEQAVAWRSPISQRSCAALLFGLWREEEARLVGATSGGMLPSPERPLSHKRAEHPHRHRPRRGSATSLEALLCHLGATPSCTSSTLRSASRSRTATWTRSSQMQPMTVPSEGSRKSLGSRLPPGCRPKALRPEAIGPCGRSPRMSCAAVVSPQEEAHWRSLPRIPLPRSKLCDALVPIPA